MDDWSDVALSPQSGIVQAYSRIERDRHDTIVSSIATLYRIADTGVRTPMELRDGTGKAWRLGPVAALVVARNGTIYVAEREQRRIMAISPGGQASVFAGAANPNRTGSREITEIDPARDGDAKTAVFERPRDMVFDGKGNLWVLDGNWIRVIDAQGRVSTITDSDLGRGERPWLGDGAPPEHHHFAIFNVSSLAASPMGEVWGYEGYKHYFFRFTSRHQWGVMELPAYPPGFETRRTVQRGEWNPEAFAFAADGSLVLVNAGYVYNKRAFALWSIHLDDHRAISPDSGVTWIAGVVRTLDADLPSWPPGATGKLHYLPSMDSMVALSSGQVVASGVAGEMLKIDSGAEPTVLADAPARPSAQSPLADRIRRAIMAPTGEVYYIGRGAVRRVSRDGTADTLVARLEPEPEFPENDPAPGGAPLSQYHAPSDLILDAHGDLLVAEPYTGLIRKVTPTGTITTLAGTKPGGKTPEDGPVAAARFWSPQRLAVDSQGAVYVLDRGIRRTIDGGWAGCIRRIDPSATTVTTVACAASKRAIEKSGGYADVAVGANDQLLALDEDGVVWAVGANGRHKRVASVPSYMSRPKELAADPLGNLYLGGIGQVDDRDSLVVRIAPDGVSTILAGDGSGGSDAESHGSVCISGLGAMRLTPDGNLLLALGSTGGTEDGITWDPRVRNPQLPMDHNDTASGIAVLETAGDRPAP